MGSVAGVGVGGEYPVCPIQQYFLDLHCCDAVDVHKLVQASFT